MMTVYSSLGVVRGPRSRGPLRCSDRYVREVVFFLCGRGGDGLLLRERLHGLPVDRRSSYSTRGRVLLRLDPTEHLEALQVFGGQLGNRVVLEVSRLHHVGESTELGVLLVDPVTRAILLGILVLEGLEELRAV